MERQCFHKYGIMTLQHSSLFDIKFYLRNKFSRELEWTFKTCTFFFFIKPYLPLRLSLFKTLVLVMKQKTRYTWFQFPKTVNILIFFNRICERQFKLFVITIIIRNIIYQNTVIASERIKVLLCLHGMAYAF